MTLAPKSSFRKEKKIGENVYTGYRNKKKRFDGLGTLITEDGTIFEGLFKDGEKDGHGRLIYPDGTLLESTWSAGV
jgi:hypothetical protein